MKYALIGCGRIAPHHISAADLGEIKTECCGEPYIQCEGEPCGNNLNIVITQSVKIKIPLKVGIRAIQGNSFIVCGDSCCEKSGH